MKKFVVPQKLNLAQHQSEVADTRPTQNSFKMRAQLPQPAQEQLRKRPPITSTPNQVTLDKSAIRKPLSKEKVRKLAKQYVLEAFEKSSPVNSTRFQDADSDNVRSAQEIRTDTAGDAQNKVGFGSGSAFSAFRKPGAFFGVSERPVDPKILIEGKMQMLRARFGLPDGVIKVNEFQALTEMGDTTRSVGASRPALSNSKPDSLNLNINIPTPSVIDQENPLIPAASRPKK